MSLVERGQRGLEAGFLPERVSGDRHALISRAGALRIDGGLVGRPAVGARLLELERDLLGAGPALCLGALS
jgi:hypothetical protein